MLELKRILCIVGSLDQGGAETFLMKLFRNLDRTKYMMDFCVMNHKKGAYEEEIATLGGKVYHITSKSENPIECFLQIRNIVKQNLYETVMRINNNSLSSLDLFAAKCGGAKKLVMRSSNANSSSKKGRILHKMFRFLSEIPNIKIAPSKKAAEYTFGKKNTERGYVNFLHNGLPVEDFIFDLQKRKETRKELNIENKFIVGHIGRFHNQKNHMFLIDVFYELLKIREDSYLLLVGEGEKKTEILDKVKTMGIEEKVMFLETRKDVSQLLSAFDILIFPSFFEGMPNVIIEAQASGLPCLISDTITEEADITGLVKYFSLEKTASDWAEEAITHSTMFERRSYKEEFSVAGYDIETVVQRFVDLVF